MKTPAPTAADIEELVAFLPRLYAPDLVPIVRWGGGLNKEMGVTFLPWPVYADVVREFFDAASKPCWRAYEYVARDVRKLLERDDGLASLGMDQVKSILTFFVRGERFCEGHWAAMIEDGHVRRLLERLGEVGNATKRSEGQ